MSITLTLALLLQAAAQPVAPPVGPPPPPPTLARPPRPIDPGSWMTQDDYPIGALATNQQGAVRFRVDVALDGSVSNCTVTESSGWPLLDEMTCSLISLRARFNPATDERGNRVTGTYSNRLRWQLPPPLPATPAPAVPLTPGS